MNEDLTVSGISNPPCDLIQLETVNNVNILNALKSRFQRNMFYTSIGPILVAVNPFKWIKEVYSDELKQQYANGNKSLSDDPHVFAKALDAHFGLQFGKNQSLIISGESGAGKTESTKQCLSYLAFAGAQGKSANADSDLPVQTRILQASPILEAWGNAKTLRNDNSSRFGKFIEIWFNTSFQIIGATNTTYLLEKSRVIFQAKGERNYHAFYQLLLGSPPNLRSELHLNKFSADVNMVEYLNKSECIRLSGVDETASFQEVQQAYSMLGINADEVTNLYRVLAGVLHMGNIKFDTNANNADEIIVVMNESFTAVLDLFGLEMESYKRALTFKKIQSGRRASSTYTPLNIATATDINVAKINKLVNNSTTNSTTGNLMIGILDIFGFEIFTKVCLHSLCTRLSTVFTFVFRIHLNNCVLIWQMKHFKGISMKIYSKEK